MHPAPVRPRWYRILYVISLFATFSGLAMAADVTWVAAKTPAFPSPTQQRQLFRQWRANQGSNLLNENPALAEALGSSQYSTGAPAPKVSYGRTAYYKVRVKSAPDSLLAVSDVTTTIESKTTRSSVLVIFVPSSSEHRWLDQSTVAMPASLDLGKPGSTLSAPTSSEVKKLLTTPTAAVQTVLTASNADLQQGTASALLPDPSWYSAESAWLQGIASENGDYTTQSSLSGYPIYAFREPSGAVMSVFTFTISNSEEEGEGFWLNTAFFPGQPLLSQNDTWLGTVAVTDPLRSSKKALSIAGADLAPIAATGTTLSDQIITFGPW
ncbi:MAG: hypothetical protein ACLQNU_05955 [Candidatus Dormibacteria bacterium]|jgi:hypothetical protein